MQPPLIQAVCAPPLEILPLLTMKLRIRPAASIIVSVGAATGLQMPLTRQGLRSMALLRMNHERYATHTL